MQADLSNQNRVADKASNNCVLITLMPGLV